MQVWPQSKDAKVPLRDSSAENARSASSNDGGPIIFENDDVVSIFFDRNILQMLP